MSRLARDLRWGLLATLRELDECDLSKLYHEAQTMVRTNRDLKGDERLVSGKSATLGGAADDESMFSGLNQAGF